MSSFMETPGIKEFHDHLWAATDPSRPHGPAKLTGHGRASVMALLPRIQLARRLIVEASFLLCVKLDQAQCFNVLTQAPSADITVLHGVTADTASTTMQLVYMLVHCCA